jgi:uncharacterized protein YlbG (UPF0298 family)
MNAKDVQIVQEEEKRSKEWPCELPFNIIDDPEFETIVNLFDFVGEGKFTTCGYVIGVARQQGDTEPCMLRFSSIYTGRQSWNNLRAELNKSAKKRGFLFTVRNTANSAQAMVWTLSCTHNIMFEDKACKREYEDGYAQFAAGMKVTMVKENLRVEQRGPTGINQPRKMETSRPTRNEDQCPLKIKIHLKKKDELFYLSKKGSVSSHLVHVRYSVIFTRADQIYKNMQKMLKDFEVTKNVKPSTASSLLHQFYDHMYDPKLISNIIIKEKNTWLSDRGINTNAGSAQVFVDYLMVSPDTSCVFLLHYPDSTLTGGAKKGRPKKSSPIRVLTKDFNMQVVKNETVPEMSEEQYTISRRKKLYLPESDCLLLYAAWITNKELRNTIFSRSFWLLIPLGGGTSIEDRMLMIVAGLDNIRRNFPSILALLPSEYQWVFPFSFSYVFPKLLGVATIRRIQQATQIQVYAIVTQLIQYLCTNLTQFIFDLIHC